MGWGTFFAISGVVFWAAVAFVFGRFLWRNFRRGRKA